MVTQLYVGKCGFCIRVVNKNCFFYFESFENGFVKLRPMMGEIIEDFAEVVEGCFNRDSNFERVMRENFCCRGEIKGIKFEFNGINFTVRKGSSDSKNIVNEYFTELYK